jgi:hypothetical protein
MTQSQVFDPPKPSIVRPSCPECGWPMWLTTVELGEDPDQDKRTFECLSCERQEAVAVRYR